MLRLPSRQAFKALRNPFRCSLPNPLRVPLQTRHLHNAPPPFSGPPSYATLAQRFSASNPSPTAFFHQKAEEEARGRGEFIDIHDFGGVDPNDYDVLFTDMDNGILHSEISKIMDIPYIAEATKAEADKVPKEIRGFIYGQMYRMIFPCVLGMNGKARWVFFIVDGGAPLTYISAEVAHAFGFSPRGSSWLGKIAGHTHPIHMSPTNSRFSTINLLGQDFAMLNGFTTKVNSQNRTATYFIGDEWDTHRKKR